MAIITEEELERRLNHESNLINILGIKSPVSYGQVKESHKEVEPAQDKTSLDLQPAETEIIHKTIDKGGAKPGQERLSQEVRILAGTLAHMDKNSNVAEALGISPSHVSRLKHGNIHLRPDEDLKKNISTRLETVRDSAVDRLIESLDIVQAGMGNIKKATTAAKVARDMAAIIDKTGPKTPESQNVTFQIYAPQVRDEKKFEVLEVERVSE